MLNWLTRYTPAARAALHDAGSILDIRCGPHGLACIAPDVPFVGADVAARVLGTDAVWYLEVAGAAAPAEPPA